MKNISFKRKSINTTMALLIDLDMITTYFSHIEAYLTAITGFNANHHIVIANWNAVKVEFIQAFGINIIPNVIVGERSPYEGLTSLYHNIKLVIICLIRVRKLHDNQVMQNTQTINDLIRVSKRLKLMTIDRLNEPEIMAERDCSESSDDTSDSSTGSSGGPTSTNPHL